MCGAKGIHVNHAAGLSLGKKLVCAHGQLCAVGEVVGDGILAADVVANLHGTGLNLKADFLELLLKAVLFNDILENRGWNSSQYQPSPACRRLCRSLYSK